MFEPPPSPAGPTSSGAGRGGRWALRLLEDLLQARVGLMVRATLTFRDGPRYARRVGALVDLPDGQNQVAEEAAIPRRNCSCLLGQAFASRAPHLGLLPARWPSAQLRGIDGSRAGSSRGSFPEPRCGRPTECAVAFRGRRRRVHAGRLTVSVTTSLALLVSVVSRSAPAKRTRRLTYRSANRDELVGNVEPQVRGAVGRVFRAGRCRAEVEHRARGARARRLLEHLGVRADASQEIHGIVVEDRRVRVCQGGPPG
jgi:hypothetical protein